MALVEATHSMGNPQWEEPENDSFHVPSINFGGTIFVGQNNIGLYTHFDRDVTLDQFEHILVELLEWTRARKAERE